MVQGPRLVRAVGADTDGSPLDRQFHLDHQGSVQALTTSSQSIEADYETDAWGNEQTANTSTNRSVYLGGLGYWQEPSLGLNYVRARWMDPITGRWLSVDSVPTEPRYLYAGNSPTMRVDPTGRNFEDSHDTRPRPRRQTRPTAAPANQSIIDQFMKLVNVHLPELQHFVQDPETVGKELILHYNELVWHKVVEETADLAADLGINHIPDFVTRSVPGTYGLARSEWEAARTRFPSIAPLLEPYPVSSRAIHWQGGFVWGIVKGIAEMAPALHPITNLIHGFDNLKALWALFQALRAKGLSKLISEAWKATRNRFFNYFEDAVHKSAFDQGKLAGILVANVVATILAVLSGIGLIKNLAALIEYLRVTGLGAEMLEALGTGGPKAVAELWKNRPTTINTVPTRKSPVDMGSGDLVYPPTDGTAMAPRGQGVAPAAGNDPIAKAGQQIDTVTRKLLVRGQREPIGPVRFYSSGDGGVKFGSTRVKRLRNVLNRRLNGTGFHMFIEGDDDGVDRAVRFAAKWNGVDIDKEYGNYDPSDADDPTSLGRAGRVWLKKDPDRATVFEELYHYIQDRDTNFSGETRNNINRYERDASIQLLAMGRGAGESGGRALSGLLALLKGTVYEADVRAVADFGWTDQERKSIMAYFNDHSDELMDKRGTGRPIPGKPAPKRSGP